MVKEYEYKVITVLFDGEVEVIHQRFLSRDVTEERHPGLASSNHLKDLEFFEKAMLPCRSFNYGHIKIFVDSTEFSKGSYDDILKKVIGEL